MYVSIHLSFSHSLRMKAFEGPLREQRETPERSFELASFVRFASSTVEYSSVGLTTWQKAVYGQRRCVAPGFCPQRVDGTGDIPSMIGSLRQRDTWNDGEPSSRTSSTFYRRDIALTVSVVQSLYIRICIYTMYI